MKNLKTSHIGKMNELDRKRAFYKHSSKDYVGISQLDFETSHSTGLAIHNIISDWRTNYSNAMDVKNKEKYIAKQNNWRKG